MSVLGRTTSYDPNVGVDLERVGKITGKLEELARDGKLTMTRFLELATQASPATDGDISEVYDLMAFVERVQPDFDRLREISAEVERLERSGAMTPLRYSSMLEQARIAVGPYGSRFVDGIVSTGLEPHFVDEILARIDE